MARTWYGVSHARREVSSTFVAVKYVLVNWMCPRSLTPVHRVSMSSTSRRARACHAAAPGARCIIGRMASVESSAVCSTSLIRVVYPCFMCGWPMRASENRAWAATIFGSWNASSTGTHHRHISQSSPHPPPNWPSGCMRWSIHQVMISARRSRFSRWRRAQSGAASAPGRSFVHGMGSPRYIRMMRFSGNAARAAWNSRAARLSHFRRTSRYEMMFPLSSVRHVSMRPR